MSRELNGSDAQLDPIRAPEYIAQGRTRHRSVNGARRVVFFGLASLWGFIVGVGGFVAAMSSSGQPVQPPPGIFLRLVPVVILALLGGLVTAWAYRESRNRAR